MAFIFSGSFEKLIFRAPGELNALLLVEWPFAYCLRNKKAVQATKDQLLKGPTEDEGHCLHNLHNLQEWPEGEGHCIVPAIVLECQDMPEGGTGTPSWWSSKYYYTRGRWSLPCSKWWPRGGRPP